LIHSGLQADVTVAPAWQNLNDGPSNSTEVASVVDGAGTLHLVTWTDGAGAGQAYNYRTIDASGTVSATSPVLSGWLGLSSPALLARADGSLSLLFFGNRLGSTADPYSAYSLYRVTSDVSRTVWTLDPVVYDGAPGLAGQSANGGVLYSGNQEVGISIQGGAVRAFNISTATAVQSTARPCCAYLANGNILGSTGEMVAGFYSNATDQAGVFFQTLFPSIGTMWQAPGAELDTRVRVPLVARGSDLYTAYAYGSTSEGVRVWKVGADAGSYIDIPGTKGAIGVTLASDGARLWAVWGVADGSTTTYVARSNRDLTSFSSFKVSAPLGATAVYNRFAQAERGRLDLFVTSNGLGDSINTKYAQIGIPLEIRVRPARVSRDGGTLTVVVTDGDSPVPGVRVSGGRRSGVTNVRGVVRLSISSGSDSLRVRATKSGYVPGQATVRRR
jgi:hypothetical protein